VTLSRTSAVWATLAVALALSAVHLFAPRIRRRLPLTSQAVTSFGGGVAATYVFLYLLPRLAEGNQAVAAVLGDKARSNPLAGLATSLVALLGFVTFYALERVTHRSQRGTAEPTRPVFLVQLAFFAAYSGLVTYRSRRSGRPARCRRCCSRSPWAYASSPPTTCWLNISRSA
jgi:hypothetical protein